MRFQLGLYSVENVLNGMFQSKGRGKKWIYDEIYAARSNKPVGIDPIDGIKFPFNWNSTLPENSLATSKTIDQYFRFNPVYTAIWIIDEMVN